MYQSELIEPKWKDGQVHLLNELFIDDSAKDLLNWALEIFSPSLYFECQFNLEDLIILELFREIGELPTVFYVDTGKLPDATYSLIKRYQQRGFKFSVYRPDKTLLSQLQHQEFSCKNNQKSFELCSYVRLNEPRERALTNAQGWVSAKRLKTEEGLPQKVEVDYTHNGILRINPLSDWPADVILRFINERKIPYNPMHGKGVRSLSCAVCSLLSVV